MLDRLIHWMATSWGDSRLWFAADVFVKATLLLAIAAGLTVLLRKRSAAVRHRVWALTFTALLLLPLANAFLPGWSWKVIPRDWRTSGAERGRIAEEFVASAGSGAATQRLNPVSSAPVTAGTLAIRNDSKETADAIASNESSPSGAPIAAVPRTTVSTSNAVGPAAPPAQSRLPWLVVLWLAGAVAALIPLVTGMAGNLRWKVGARPPLDSAWQDLLFAMCQRIELRRDVTLVFGGPDQMPMTFGWLRPCVVLPSDAASWPRDRREMVLLHELAHVQRCDVLWQMIARLACALYWFHPAAWYGLRRMRLEREHACDDCALLAGQKPSDYASQLLEIARAHRTCSPLASAALSMARPSQLEGRLLAVLDAHRSRAPLSAAHGVALALSALLLVVGLLRPAVQAEIRKSADGQAASAAKTLTDESTVAADSDSPVTVAGTLLSPQGKPVVGGLIEIVAVDDDGYWGRRMKKENVRYYSITSDSAGHYEIALPRELSKNYRLELSASADGLATYQIGFGLEHRHQQRIELPKLTLPEPKIFHFQLMDTAGNPVANVRPKVWGWEVERGADESLKSWPKCSQSGEDGECSVTMPAETKEIFLLVENERFGCQLLQVKPVADPIGVVLKPGRFLSGQVVAADTGLPLAGFEVLLEAQPSRSTRTENDGRYHIAVSGGSPFDFRFLRGETIVQVYPPADSPYLFHAMNWKWPNNVAGNAMLTIKMEKGIVVEGDVLEKGSGKAIAGATVYFEPQEYNNRFFREGAKSNTRGSDMKYRTDVKGHFRLPVWPGSGYVLVKAPTSDYLHVVVSTGEKRYGEPGLWREYHDGAFHLSLKPDEKPAPIKIELQRGITLRRRVVRPDGQPAQCATYARSYLPDESPIVEYGVRPARVEDGVLELPGFEPEGSNPLFIIDSDHHCAAMVSPSGSEIDLASPPIQLQRTGSARFRFLNDQGEALANHHPNLLLIVTPGSPATRFLEPKQPLWSDSINWNRIVSLPPDKLSKTGSDGRVVVSDLIPGATYRVSVLGKNGMEDERYEFTVRPGETTDVGDVTLVTQR
ncbi:MAG TPA: M56 family metallopeptidase [Pirellulales bacterium]|nr:M56 family metallopeptidase [Pirellulales bacterium]